MKVSEKSISIWTVVNLHKDELFRNPAFNQNKPAQRVTSIGQLNGWEMRFWKEYFCQFTESLQNEHRSADYLPDSQKQLDSAIESDVDQQILLQSLLERTNRQLDIANQQQSAELEQQIMLFQKAGGTRTTDVIEGEKDESENVQMQEADEEFMLGADDTDDLFKDLLLQQNAAGKEEGKDALSELLDEEMEKERVSQVAQKTDSDRQSPREHSGQA